jgi:hypothetical protein
VSPGRGIGLARSHDPDGRAPRARELAEDEQALGRVGQRVEASRIRRIAPSDLLVSAAFRFAARHGAPCIGRFRGKLTEIDVRG